jgi:hypothetical protein
VDLIFGDLALFPWTSGSNLLDNWRFRSGIYNNQLINITMEKSKVNETFSDVSSRDDYIIQYKTIAENRGKKKIIKGGEEFAYDIILCGYFMSPFENRALVIIGVARPDYE